MRLVDLCAFFALLTGRAHIAVKEEDDSQPTWTLVNPEDFAPGNWIGGRIQSAYSVEVPIHRRYHPAVTPEQVRHTEQKVDTDDEFGDWMGLALALTKGRSRMSFIECYAALDQALREHQDEDDREAGLCRQLGDVQCAHLVHVLEPWLNTLVQAYNQQAVEDQLRAYYRECDWRIERLREDIRVVRSRRRRKPHRVLRASIRMISRLRHAYVHWASVSPDGEPKLFRIALDIICELMAAYWRSRLGVPEEPAPVAVSDQQESVVVLKIHDDVPT
jgi:hypothetical protein